MTFSVVQYDSDHVANPNPNGETPFEDFWKVRDSILKASQKHGDTGPESRSDSPRYWLVEDQYNDELYQHMEVYEPNGWTTEWLLALIDSLREHKPWAVSIGNIDQGHLLIFGDRIMATGPTFAKCSDLESVVIAARTATGRLEERKNGPLSRQLDYIKQLLPTRIKDADRNAFAYLATFNGYQLSEGNAIWILQTGDRDQLRLDSGCSFIRATAVSTDGTIHPEFCKEFWPYTDESPPYWLLTYMAEDRAQSSFNVVDEEGRIFGTVKIGEITSDEQLLHSPGRSP